MAYGMRASELAAVGRNVNNQGGEVTDESLAAAFDQELQDERKEDIRRFKERRSEAISEDVKKKAELKKNLVDALKTSGKEVAGAVSKSPKAEQRRALRDEKKSFRKEKRLTGGAERLEGNPDAKQKRISRIRKRASAAGDRGTRLMLKREAQSGNKYNVPGSLYGSEDLSPRSDAGQMYMDSEGPDPMPSQYDRRLIGGGKATASGHWRTVPKGQPVNVVKKPGVVGSNFKKKRDEESDADLLAQQQQLIASFRDK